jgi:putative nucleotidyltransferase with HDIG domain
MRKASCSCLLEESRPAAAGARLISALLTGFLLSTYDARTMPDQSPEALEAAVRAEAASGRIPLAALAESRARLDGDAAAVVDSDIALTLSLLKQANAGRSGTVGSVADAASLIGPQGVRAVVGSLPLFDPLASGTDTGPSPDRLRVHAAQVRDLAERLAELVGHRDGALLATAAILHDVGKPVIAQVAPAYSQFLVRAEPPEIRVRREREAIGIDHAEAGALVLEACEAPEVLVRAVRYHHSTDAKTGDEARLIALANMLAHYRSGRSVDPEALVQTAAQLGLGREEVGALLYDLGPPLTAGG